MSSIKSKMNLLFEEISFCCWGFSSKSKYVFVSVIIMNCRNYALAKNGSFGFAKAWIVCRAKPNVPFVRLANIVSKKFAVGKNKNTEALTFGSAV